MHSTLRSLILSCAISGILAPLPLLAQSEPRAQARGDAPAPKAAEVPVKQVVLFSSGVGYFEHFGTVQGDGSTELRFKTAQINDILKSLILQDLDNGKVTTITYPSQDPIAKTLRSFQVDITNNPSLADLLNQLRGAKVSLKLAGDSTLSGTIVGVEKKQKPVGDGKSVIERPALNLLVGASIKSVYIEDVTEITLDDPQLQEELTRALSALAAARDQDKKPVQINFTGQGERRVRIGYVVETPIWKTSYRLILSDDEKQKNQIQGWAIVENQTDNDWNNVQLSLVSGRPISFIQDLYQPLYIPRPVVVPELFASLTPQQYGEGLVAKDKLAELRSPQLQQQTMQQARRRGAAGGAPASPAPAEAKSMQDGDFGGSIDPSASVTSVASAAKIGELFQYTVGNVSLPRQKSAMLPIITDPIEVEKVSIYNASVLPRNPLNGARVKNTTEKHLLQGPITVLDAGTYAGDARIDNVPPGQERLLSYGVDLQMLIDAKNNKSESTLQTGKIVKGVLQLSRKHTFTQEYIAQNKADRDKTLIIEEPIRPSWKLVDTEKPMETTDSVYRFKVAVPKNESGKFTVKQEVVAGEEIALLPADLTALDFYSRAGEIPQPVRDVLIRAMQMKQAVAETERQMNETAQQIGQITQEQNRIRENMRTVNQQSEYYNRLLKKLNDQESQIEKMQQTTEEMRKTRDKQRADLETFLNGVTVG